MQVAVSGKNERLVTDEPVEFEKEPVEVGEFRRISDHFREIYREYTANEYPIILENILQMNERKTGRCQHVTGWI